MSVSSIVVVGAGCSGACVTRELCQQAMLRRGNPALTITVVDKGQPHLVQDQLADPASCFWKGAAYSATADYHLLNIPTHGMSAVEGRLNDFAEWLEEGVKAGKVDEQWIDYDHHGHAPRRLFGQYLNDRTTTAIEAAKTRGVDVRLVTGEVVDVQRQSAQLVVRVVGAAGGQAEDVIANSVVLCHGNLTPQLLRPLRGLVGQTDRFVPHPWAFPVIAEGSKETVGIIGTRLTAIDFLLHLRHKCNHKGKVVFFSRTGKFPKENPGERLQPVWAELGPRAFPELEGLERDSAAYDAALAKLPLVEIAQRLRQVFTAAEPLDVPWQIRVDSLRPFSNGIWRTRNDEDRQLFLRELRGEFEIHRHRVAPNVIKAVEELMAHGIATHVEGALLEAVPLPSGGGIRVTLADNTTHDVQWLVNCTGPDSDYRDPEVKSALVRSLRDHRLITPQQDGIAMIVDRLTGETVCGDGNPSGNIYAVGPPRRGLEWETIAVREIRQQAATVAQQILEKL